jgi:hypothetical protein
MRKLWLVPILLLYLAGLTYLVQPTPPVPDLPGGLRSDEPGDTWQNPTQKAFFTDMTRAEVLAFYQNSYKVNFSSITFPLLRLNYRPEDTAVYVRKYIDAYWLEEVVHPLRESIFINGWTPRLAPVNAGKTAVELEKIRIVVGDKVFQSKITLRWYESPLWARLLVWTLIFPLSYLVLLQFTQTLSALKRAIFK